MTWRLDSLQLAIIFGGPFAVDPVKAWSEIVNIEMDGYGRNPIPSTPGGHATGVAEGITVALVSQPGRLDFNFTVVQEPHAEPGTIFLDEVKAFDLMDRIAMPAFKYATENSGPVRTAINVARAWPTASGDEAVQVLKDHVPQAKEFLVDGASDIVLTINKPRAYEISAFGMNRVCSWQSVIAQFFQLHFTAGAANATPKQVNKHAAVLKTDVNNTPSEISLGLEEIMQIYRENLKETKRLSGSGFSGLMG